MIKASELRIGNIVRAAVKINIADFKTPDYLIVDDISIRDCAYYKENWAWKEVRITAKTLKMFFGIKTPKEGLIKIDLDPEIKLELEKEDDGYSVFIRQSSRHSFDFILFFNGLKMAIKSIHELQNLFHALTGRELPIVNYRYPEGIAASEVFTPTNVGSSFRIKSKRTCVRRNKSKNKPQ